MRKAAFRKVREDGCTLTDALTDVIKDQELRSLYFLSPLLLSANQRSSVNSTRHAVAQSAPSGGQPRGDKRKRGERRQSAGTGASSGQPRNNNKGAGKGAKNKGDKDKDGRDLMSKTADGRDLCFNWNAGRPCEGKCGRVHACRVGGCMATHRAIDHK
jgi:hypothetical protein